MARSPLITPLLGLLLRLALGAAFVVAGAMKVLDPAAFTGDIENYQIVGYTTAALAALYLPWLEIVCGLTVMSRRLYLGGLVIVTGLMIVFIPALVSAWVRGLNINCGCFGAAGAEVAEPTYLWWLTRDIAMLAAAVGLLVFDAGSRGKQRQKLAAAQPVPS